MSPGEAGISAVWSCVAAGMAAFLIIASRREPGRGYEFLGLGMGSVAVGELLDAGLILSGPTQAGLLLARGSSLFGLFGVAFNLHFILRFSGREKIRSVLWLTYVAVGAAALTNLLSTVQQFEKWQSLVYPGDYRSPFQLFSLYCLTLIIAHFFYGAVVLWTAHKKGRPRARGVLLALLVLFPAVVLDTASLMFLSEKWFVTQAGTWLYSLVVLVGLVSEMEGAAGLLQATTSSLAERTAELEVSYAEIDLMHTELFQKQQLAAVGELAAAIAHEVRNPLAIIMNAVSAMKRPTISVSDKDTLLNIVNEEAERLNHLVTELLRFARPVAASTGPANLMDICERASREAPKEYNVKVQKPGHSDLPQVLVDPGLFRLALDNLMANSHQAMNRGGEILLSVRPTTLSDDSLGAAVDISDAGCGMKESELENARKPFFTTKPRGTGLGIPIVERIVDAHGGEMLIRSEVGQGTTVTIKLPAEVEVARISYPGSKHPSNRRRLRSIPPGLQKLPETEE